MPGFDTGPLDVIPSQDQWFVSDPLSQDFRSEVPAAASLNLAVMIRRGLVALVEISGAWTTAARIVPPDTWPKYVGRCADGKARDVRLLGDVRDTDGHRFLSFRKGVMRSQEAMLPGFP